MVILLQMNMTKVSFLTKVIFSIICILKNSAGLYGSCTHVRLEIPTSLSWKRIKEGCYVGMRENIKDGKSIKLLCFCVCKHFYIDLGIL